jgi:hypothetical protein
VFILKARPALIVIVIGQMIAAAVSQSPPSKVIGNWKVEIAFPNGEGRSLQFEARESGRGSFLLLDPSLKAWGPAKPTEAKWTPGEGNSVSFSGKVEFPLGNVGRDAGTLVLHGKLGTDNTMTGEAKFFRGDEDSADPKVQPAKSGTFKASRITG